MSTNFLDFTLANIISIAIWGFGVVAVWFKMKAAVELMSQRVDKQEEELRELSKIGVLNAISQHERRLITLETNLGEISAMKRDIEWIRSALNHRESTNE